MAHTLTNQPRPTAVRRRITVRGVVQGVGFRPYVHRLASELALSGFVGNEAAGVVAEVEGEPGAVEEFCRRLGERPPPLAEVREVTHRTVAARGVPGFAIRTSAPGVGLAAIPPDTATCADCLRELADPADRRYRHPFITCTHCGPRLTIATGLPYDRASTTMADFAWCPACAAEYADPADRRFHAQPVACPSCGPRLRLAPAPGSGATGGSGEAALAEARRLLAGGAVVAVKGIGGYHLACDAADPAAVATLRRRKARGGKPFAVMCADLPAAERVARIGPAERAVLTGRRRPIVLLPRADRPTPDLAAEVCPGSPDVGVLLPYTPLHQLLFGLPGDPPGPRVLVMTSGNRSGEPIVTDDDEALDRLAGLADAWLLHDRRIEVPCDDSVVRMRQDGTVLVLRRSRGYAPAPVRLPFDAPECLAVGGDLKGALCLGADRTAWFSPHLGDLADPVALRALDRGARRLTALTGVTPRLVAADRHPGYHATRWARGHAAGRPVRLVQHHHAHVASAMVENGWPDTTPVVGVAFDGTGYGDDAAVWGGEVLLADYRGYRRLAHLAYVPLPGGDAGVANPCRMALAHLRAAGIRWEADLPCVAACSPAELRVLDRQLDRGLVCVPTSSMGRLFDAVASLAGVCHRVGYEAQAAIEWEAAARTAWPVADAGRRPDARGAPGDAGAADPPDGPPSRGGYAFGRRPATSGEGPATIDPAPVLRAVVGDLRRRVPTGLVAARFHLAVVAAVVRECAAARRATGVSAVALSGGVFGNALLDQECAARLTAGGFTVLRHREVPPGDGGLALGQLAVAACQEPARR